MKSLLSLLLIFSFLLCQQAIAQQSDNENGTYTNPLIWADFPDPDIIKAGDCYYMVSTTAFVFPGAPLLKSYDLVNWEYATNILKKLDAHKFYNLDGGNRYAHGQWATSLKYHNGKYYALFITLDEGGFLCTADNPEGEWTVTKLKKGFYDPGLFFDDNGKVYVFHGYSTLSLTEVNKNDLSPLSADSVIFRGTFRGGFEGTHVYKLNGLYYIFGTYGGDDGYQACLRSKNIYGPYEEKVVLNDDMNVTGLGVHQGGLIQIPNGDWWAVVFQDRIGVGRVPILQPVFWKDGWPMVGVNDKAVVTYKKPNMGKVFPVKVLPTSDEFENNKLGLQWGWNHNPDNSKWSLSEKKGNLRLKTANVSQRLWDARNTLTQRMYGPYSIATIEMDLTAMQDGDRAGLGVFQDPHGYIQAEKVGNKVNIVMGLNQNQILGKIENYESDKIYFRAFVSTISDKATFYYSSDNKLFKKLGEVLNMEFRLSVFTGNKFCIFNYATKNTGGFVDVNWFRMETKKGPANLYSAQSMIEAEWYDNKYNCDTEWSNEKPGVRDQNITLIKNGSWLKFDQIDFGQGVAFFYANIAAGCAAGGTIELRLDSLDGQLIGKCDVAPTDSWSTFSKISCSVENVKGIRPLVLKFTGSDNGMLMKMNWFSFNRWPRSFKEHPAVMNN